MNEEQPLSSVTITRTKKLKGLQGDTEEKVMIKEYYPVGNPKEGQALIDLWSAYYNPNNDEQKEQEQLEINKATDFKGVGTEGYYE